MALFLPFGSHFLPPAIRIAVRKFLIFFLACFHFSLVYSVHAFLWEFGVSTPVALACVRPFLALTGLDWFDSVRPPPRGRSVLRLSPSCRVSSTVHPPSSLYKPPVPLISSKVPASGGAVSPPRSRAVIPGRVNYRSPPQRASDGLVRLAAAGPSHC